MPGHEPSLHVTATCTCPTSGYRLELKPHVPQGINPKDYILDLIEHKPTGPVSQVMTDVAVEYVEDTDFSYETVSITPDGPSSIPVKEVS